MQIVSNQYQSEHVTSCMMKYYASLSLLVASHNIINDESDMQNFSNIAMPGIEECEASELKQEAVNSIQVAFNLFSIKE